MHDPYSPKEHASPAIPGLKKGRPASVWFFLVVCSVVIAITAFTMIQGLAQLPSESSVETDFSAPVFSLASGGVLLFVCIAMLALVSNRRQLGRKLGVFAIGFLVLIAVFSPNHTPYASFANQLGGVKTRLIFIPCLMHWWGYRFGFSTRSKAYFDPPDR